MSIRESPRRGATRTLLSGGTNPRALAIGDLSGDGIPDLAVANGQGNVAVLWGLGNGVFSVPTTVLAAGFPRDVAIGDITGDGIADLAVTIFTLGTVSVLAGTGGGGFAAPIQFPVGSGIATLVLTDLSGDGKLDIATARAPQAATVTVLPNQF